MTGHAKARMPKAMAAIPRSNTSHQLSAMVRNSATPAKGGLESICVLVIERFPQLEPSALGLACVPEPNCVRSLASF
jgi:hypothetical protein